MNFTFRSFFVFSFLSIAINFSFNALVQKLVIEIDRNNNNKPVLGQ